MEKESASSGRLGRIAAAMTSFAGIATAIATIMTSVTAALGVAIHHQTAQLQQAHQQVSQQAHQILVLQSNRTAHTAAPEPSVATSPDASQGGIAHYLSNLTPTVDNQSAQNGQEVISAVPYPNSISFTCNGSFNSQPGEAYDVAGNTVFTAEVGLADNTNNVTGVIATVVFSNEAGQALGKPVQVSLGHPKKITLNISGVTQFGMTCNGRDAQTGETVYNFDVALGDAGIS